MYGHAALGPNRLSHIFLAAPEVDAVVSEIFEHINKLGHYCRMRNRVDVGPHVAISLAEAGRKA